MYKNLMIEWLKVRNYRTFWVLLILFVVCMIGVNYVVYHLKKEVGTQAVSMFIGNPFEFPDVWQTVTYISSFLLFLPGLIVLILITNEYNFKTHRQNIIDGISRFDFALTKILVVLKLSVFATIIAALIAVFIGISGNTSFSFDHAGYLWYFFLQALTYSLAGLVFGFLFKRSGLAIALYFIYLFFLKNILTFFINHYFSSIGDYFPIKSSDNLIQNPLIQKFSKEIHFLTPPNVPLLIIFTVVYLIAFYFIIVKKFTTEDL
ncbi:hypothetical protein A9P82_05295 [Arachidicoccus ginsenosidimutans]|uniref:ABC transporter permease n=1 Tax=Arachidicoccus sp. BS20 TaxID=1850526 RepID=UPI0007F16137|nr:ABC transporter permease [Arachidicoccus sp. BS20]ANI88751.1 hypothetical protein A9P82_05295 [Arachidicoccus sp. BS20]